MVDTPPRFIMKNTTLNTEGMVAGSCASFGSSRPVTTISTRYAKNQGSALVVPANMRAPIGDRIDQIMTVLDAANPPKLYWSKKGKRRMSESWLKRKTP